MKLFPLSLCGPAAAVALSFVTAAGAQTIGRVPGMVVNDNNGNPIGPVVFFDAGVGKPIVRFEDTNVNVPVFLEIASDTQIEAQMSSTFFQLADCDGDAYHNSAFGLNEDGVQALYGYAYSVAIKNAAQRLFRTNVNDAPSLSTSYNSTFSANNGCQNQNGTIDARTATEVVNLDAMFPPPYTGG